MVLWARGSMQLNPAPTVTASGSPDDSENAACSRTDCGACLSHAGGTRLRFTHPLWGSLEFAKFNGWHHRPTVHGSNGLLSARR